MAIGELKEKINFMPNKPGVYLMHNSSGKVIYVGKAKSLKKRLRSYLRHSGFSSPRLRKLISEVEDISVIRTENEAEALIVESKLIKLYQPFYNVELKMGEKYPFIKLTTETFPRLVITRHKEDDGGTYFGPYVNVKQLRQLLRIISRYFPIRDCSRQIKDAGGGYMRPCIRYFLGQCLGPCAGLCDKREYQENVADVILLLKGQPSELVSRLRHRMDYAAKSLAFEKAARLRDAIRVIWKFSRQRPSSSLSETMDDEIWKAFLLLQSKLNLRTVPWRIEGFDISHHAGKETYGSCVVFEQGLPNPSLYRRYKINLEDGPDDFRAMKELVFRRYKRLKDKQRALPQLILIDGGPQQLRFAMEAIKEVQIKDIDVVALAKKEELLYLPEREEPIVLSRNDEGLKLLQRVRNEAHRFALAAHTAASTRRFSRSSLEDIPGVGKIIASRLLAKFGSVANIAMMPPEDIAQVKGVSLAMANKIVEKLKGDKNE
ncbi:MAG: excinuclease ABC subunit UvrC [Thermovirga sp.]|nr:excinuclease ABC subunit UvrC [Thermovirga sp.]